MSDDTLKIILIVDLFLLFLGVGFGLYPPTRIYGWGAACFLVLIALLILSYKVMGK